MSFPHNIPLYLPGEQLKLHLETSHYIYSPDRTITVNIEEQVKRDTYATINPLVVINFGDLRAVLKLYDYRYPNLRENHRLPPWSAERAAQTLQFMGTPLGQRLSDPKLRSERYRDLDLWHTVPEFAYNTLRGETAIYADCVNNYETEVRAYDILKPLQNRGLIPKLLGTVSFQLGQVADPALQKYYTIRGIILEHIPDSYCLGRIWDSAIPVHSWEGIFKSALDATTEYGKLGIIYPDRASMDYSFLVRQDYSVVLTDFSKCKFEQDYDTWQDWMVEKARNYAERGLYGNFYSYLMRHARLFWKVQYEDIWGKYEHDKRTGKWRYDPPSYNEVQKHGLKPNKPDVRAALHYMIGRQWEEVMGMDYDGIKIKKIHRTSKITTVSGFMEYL